MKTTTAEAVASISQAVRDNWATCPKAKRLLVIEDFLLNSDTLFISIESDRYNIRLYTDEEHTEMVLLSIDGDIGVYYISDIDDRKPIRISLLTTRKVRIVKTFEVDVPCVGTEDFDTLFTLANDYDEKIMYIHQEEILE